MGVHERSARHAHDPGLALFYGGRVRAKTVLNMIMMSSLALGVVTVIWVVYGYSLAFGTDTGPGLILDHRRRPSHPGAHRGTRHRRDLTTDQEVASAASFNRRSVWTMFARLWSSRFPGMISWPAALIGSERSPCRRSSHVSTTRVLPSPVSSKS